jgi:hypothetical protein
VAEFFDQLVIAGILAFGIVYRFFMWRLLPGNGQFFDRHAALLRFLDRLGPACSRRGHLASVEFPPRVMRRRTCQAGFKKWSWTLGWDQILLIVVLAACLIYVLYLIFRD